MIKKSEIKQAAELSAVKDLARNISTDYKTMMAHGKKPEPEHFYENWIRLNITKKFPKEYYSTLWKLFINSLATKKK